MLLVSMVTVSLVSIWTTRAAQISFSAKPRAVLPHVTESLTVYCGLLDIPGHYGIVKYVTSILIFRNERELASIKRHEDAKVKLDKGHLVGKGNIPYRGDENAFLELFWRKPSSEQGGEYRCYIGTIDEIGDSKSYRAAIYVDVRKPSAKGIYHMSGNTDNNPESKAKMEAEMSKMVSNLYSRFEKTLAQTDRERDLAECNRKMLPYPHYIGVFHPIHIENGMGKCFFDDADTSKDYRLKISVTFAKPYTTLPKINLGLVRLDKDYEYNTRVEITAVNISTTAFQVFCWTWGKSVGRMYQVYFNWLSFGE